MIYLGTLGTMVGIKCPTVQRVNHADRYTFNTTLGGAVKAQVGPPGRRAWDLNLGKLATPSDVGPLMEFATGVWGPGPFRFIPADAPVVNMLAPDASTCAPATLSFSHHAKLLGSPPMTLNDTEVVPRSVWKTLEGDVTLGGQLPVFPDTSVTGSAWVTGAGRLRLVFENTVGTILSIVDSPYTGSAVPQRLSVTAMAPPRTVAVRLIATHGVTQLARPAVTWTDQPYEWGEGQGCHKAVIDNTTRDLVRAVQDSRGGRWSELSFTVHEVG